MVGVGQVQSKWGWKHSRHGDAFSRRAFSLGLCPRLHLSLVPRTSLRTRLRPAGLSSKDNKSSVTISPHCVNRKLSIMRFAARKQLATILAEISNDAPLHDVVPSDGVLHGNSL